MLKVTLSQAIEGYMLDARARQLSPCTLRDYQNSFRHLQEYLGDDPIVTDITTRHIREFLKFLGTTEISPNGCAPRPSRTLSKKTIRNIHIGLSALWTWAVNESLAHEHIVRAVKPPKAEKVVIEPFTKEEIVLLLAACDKGKTYTREGKKPCANTRPTSERDRALILTLLDTGARASELCADPRRDAPGALLRDYNESTGALRVMGKGSKERLLMLSPRTQKYIWRYLTTRPDRHPDENIFMSQEGLPLTSTALLRLIQRLGKRAGVANCHPHRFRHTFAITFLRNDGRVLELQQLLGHSTIQMVQHYAMLAESDLDRAMRRASPVTNWRL